MRVGRVLSRPLRYPPLAHKQVPLVVAGSQVGTVAAVDVLP
ncbi:hypothetical protein FTUN_5416 [Frigoriglobus tundricola]|uniref:Uncharacterized protein n=1 Tax=Frigoriglobus tundricola TaxID=2774151 RepID=A0A6M5YWR2_9BACT|nr:hypothetical protein FTUN_5416 [Frigoriglobus tundricola]